MLSIFSSSFFHHYFLPTFPPLLFEIQQLFLKYQMMIKQLELKLLLKPANIMPHLIVKKLVDFAIYVPPHQLVPNVQPFANLEEKNVPNSVNPAKIDV